MTSPGGDTRMVKILVAADVSAAIKAMSQVADATDNIGKAATETSKRTSGVGDVLKGTLGAAGIQAGFDGIIGGFKSVVSSGVSFEQAQNQWQAVTGASASQMDQLSATARALGNDVKLPGASATTATAAMLELAKGGLTAQESLDAARGTMTLAAAAQIDGAQAAEIQANALNMFGLQAGEAGRVANVLANVSNAASGSITDFSQALSAGGTVASSFGWSIEETTAVLGAMAAAGIKGSDAGTSMKSAMTAMLNPSKQAAAALEELGIQTHDASGQMISARDLTIALAAAKGRMSDADFNAAAAAAFGQDAVRTSIVLAQSGAEGYDKYATALTNADGATQAAAANSKGLSGVIDGFKNAIDDASQSLFTALSPSLQTTTTAISNLVEPLSVGLAPILGVVAETATGTLAPALDGLAGFLGAVAGPIADVLGLLKGLPDPIGIAVFALGGVIALRGPLTATFSQAAATGATLLATLRGTSGAAAAGSAGLAGWIASMRAASGAAATFGVVAKGALSVLGGPIGVAIVGAATALSFFSSSTDDATIASVGFGAAIDENTGKLKENAEAIISKAAAEGGSFDAIEAIGGSVETYTAALKGNSEAQDQVHTLLLDQATAALRNSDAWGRMVAQGKQTSAGARDVASSILATGDAGNYASEQFAAVLLASQKFAADSDAIATAERRKGQEIKGSGDAARNAAGDVLTFDEALRQVQADAEKANQPTSSLADALKEMRSAASDADTASQFLAVSLERLAGGHVTAETATRANEAAFRAIGGAARDYADAQQKVADKEAELAELSNHLGAEYKGQTVTQADLDRVTRELADAKDGVAAADDRQFQSSAKVVQTTTELAGAAYNAKAAQGDMQGAIAEATRIVEEQRQKFVDAQTQINGGNIPAAQAYADELGLIPGNVITTFEQQGIADAQRRADELNAALNLMNNRTIYYTVVGTEVRKFVTGDYNPADLHADGGYISGPGTGTSDSIPAMLSNGEYVVRASQTAKHRELLEDINAGRNGYRRGGLVGYAAGGPVKADAPAAATGDASESVSATVTAPDPKLFEGAWAEIVKSTEQAWSTGIDPVLSDLSKQNTKTGEEVQSLDERVMAPAWRNISTNIETAWNRSIQPSFRALDGGSQQSSLVQVALRDQFQQAWQQNQASTDSTANWLVGSTFPMLNDGSNQVGATQAALAATTTASWTQIGAIIQATYTTQIVPAWTGVQGFAAATGDFFKGIQAGMSGAAGTVLSELGKIRAAVGSFMQMVGGSVPAAADGGAVAQLLEGKADGGPITQGTGPRADDVLIRVSKGEYVVNAEATKRNRHTLDAINYGGMQRFADGGAVGEKIRKPVEDTIVGGAHKAIEAAINKLVTSVGGFFSNGQWGPGTDGSGLAANTQAARDFIVKNWGITNIGGVYGGSVPGSDHPIGKALDVMIANYMSPGGIAQGDSVANWFIGHPNAFGTKYVIWRDRINEGGSWSPYQHPSGSNDTLQHRDHVHLSFLTGTGSFSGNPVGDGSGGGGSWLDRMLAKINGGISSSNVAYTPSAGVEQWRATVMQALSLTGQPGDYANIVLNQMRTESGGNPRAINNYDSNAQRGDPSRGLMQTIGSTFNAYRLPNLSADIYDPLSNIVAAIRYVLDRYGSIPAGMQGHAYDTGGIWPNGTAGWNTSGGPEMVLKPWQWAAAQSAIQHVTNQANKNYQGGNHGGLHIHGDMVNNNGTDVIRRLQLAALGLGF